MNGSTIMKLLWNFHQDATSGTLSRHHLFSMEDMDVHDGLGDGVRWMESLMKLLWNFHQDQMSDDRYYPSEGSEKVLSRSNIRNPVKTPSVLQVSSWSLQWRGGSWCTWRWCHMIGIILQKLLWKFHQDPTSETLSRLHLSSKYLPGVLEDVEVPDEPGIGVRW